MEEELKKQLEHSRTLLKILTYFRVNPFKKEDEKDIQLFNNSVFGFLSELDSKGFDLESLEYFEDWSGNKLCERLIEIDIKKLSQKLGFIKGTPGVLKGAEKEIFKRVDEFNALELFIKNNQNSKVNEDFQGRFEIERVHYSDFKKLLEHKAPKSGKTPIQWYLQNEITRINEYWKDYFYFTPILEQWVTFLKYELEEVKNNNYKPLGEEPPQQTEKPKSELKLNEFFIKEVSSDTIEAIQTEFRELEGKDLAILIYLLHKEHKIIEILTNSRTKGRKGFVKCLKETDNPTMQKVNKCFTPNTDDLIYSKDDLVFQSLNKKLTKTIKI